MEDQAGSVAKPAPLIQPQSSVMNLLSAENGGHVIVATNDRWLYSIDGDEKTWQYIDVGLVSGWAVYGFKDDKPRQTSQNQRAARRTGRVGSLWWRSSLAFVKARPMGAPGFSVCSGERAEHSRAQFSRNAGLS